MAHVDRSEICATSPLVSISYVLNPLDVIYREVLNHHSQAWMRGRVSHWGYVARHQADTYTSSFRRRSDHVGPRLSACIPRCVGVQHML